MCSSTSERDCGSGCGSTLTSGSPSAAGAGSRHSSARPPGELACRCPSTRRFMSSSTRGPCLWLSSVIPGTLPASHWLAGRNGASQASHRSQRSLWRREDHEEGEVLLNVEEAMRHAGRDEERVARSDADGAAVVTEAGPARDHDVDLVLGMRRLPIDRAARQAVGPDRQLGIAKLLVPGGALVAGLEPAG